MNIHRRFRVPSLILFLGFLIGGGIFSLNMAHAASPKIATPPPYTTSLVEQTINLSVLQSQGCAAAKGSGGVIILNFGKPQYHNHAFGTILKGTVFASDGAITKAVDSFIKGAWNCHTNNNQFTIAVGTSNYDYKGLEHILPLWKNAGIHWGQMINSVQSYIVGNGYNSIFTASGADDIEVNEAQNWATYNETASFVTGYSSATTALLIDNGTDPGGANPAPWTPQQLWSVVAGTPNSVILPQIYTSDEATANWEPFDQWACANEGGPMKIIGTTAHNPANPLTPDQAWTAMYNALGTDSCTSATQSQMVYSTNF